MVYFFATTYFQSIFTFKLYLLKIFNPFSSSLSFNWNVQFINKYSVFDFIISFLFVPVFSSAHFFLTFFDYLNIFLNSSFICLLAFIFLLFFHGLQYISLTFHTPLRINIISLHKKKKVENIHQCKSI